MSPGLNSGYLRDRSARTSNSHGPTPSPVGRDDGRSKGFTVPGIEEEGSSGIGSRGCIWGTEEREYRSVYSFFLLILG